MSDDIYIIKLKRRGVDFVPSIDFLEEIHVHEIMVKEPISVSPKDRIEQVIHLMKTTGHTGYPVIANCELKGIITEHDVDKALAQLGVKEWIVSEVCTKKVITVLPNCPISIIFLKMAKHNINRMPVIESRQFHKLVGWITRSDVMRCYWVAKSEKIHKKHEETLFDRFETSI